MNILFISIYVIKYIYYRLYIFINKIYLNFKMEKPAEISFEFIKENCKTIGDIQKLESEIREFNRNIL